jgi:hypothetical protein
VFIYVIELPAHSRSEMSSEFSESLIHLVPHLEWITMHRLSPLTIGIFVFAGRIIMESYCLQLGKYFSFSKWLDCPFFSWKFEAFIPDKRIDLIQPTSPLDLWMSSILDDGLAIQCPSSINFTTFGMLSDESMINTNRHLLGKVWSNSLIE